MVFPGPVPGPPPFHAKRYRNPLRLSGKTFNYKYAKLGELFAIRNIIVANKIRKFVKPPGFGK